MLAAGLFDLATSYKILVFILLQILSPIRAAPNSLSTSQEGETDELPTFGMTFEGNQVIRSGETSGPSLANAHRANPKMLWPGGVVEYKFYQTFPSEHRAVMKQAMGYITSRTPCVTFVPGNSISINYVIIAHGSTCSSELGMKGGQQVLFMNEDCFRDGLITPVHELLHTVGFTRQTPSLPDETWHEPNPTDPLSLIDQVELSMAYGCEEQMSSQTLLRYIHQNRRHNSLRINSMEPKLEQIEDETAKLKDMVDRLSTRIDGNERNVIRLSKRGAQCGYRAYWEHASSTITYDSLLTNTGSGSLNAGTGVWTAQETGLYQISWSLRNWLDNDEENSIYLYKNNVKMEAARHYSQYAESRGFIADQGGRTLLLELNSNDHLSLQTDTFTEAFRVTFCVHLLSAA